MHLYCLYLSPITKTPPSFHLRVPCVFSYSIIHTTLLPNHSILLPPQPFPQFVCILLHLDYSRAPPAIDVCTVYEAQHRFMSRVTLFKEQSPYHISYNLLLLACGLPQLRFFLNPLISFLLFFRKGQHP